MKKILKVLFIVLAIAAAFLLGFAAHTLTQGVNVAAQVSGEPVAIAAPELRVFDGNVEWSDGARWHVLCSAKELSDADPIALAREVALALATADAQTAEETDAVLGFDRGSGSVAAVGGGDSGYSGGYSGGGGSSGGDGEDISWSGDYL